jgi:hypothetical protein
MELRVDCTPAEEGWRCDVRVGTDSAATSHVVTITAETIRKMAGPGADPTSLVTESFRFLLDHEPRESILRSFELPLIGRYFPGWEREIRERLRHE